MDWDKKQDVTMDFPLHSHHDDRLTTVLTELVELSNLLSNHLGSNIDPNEKATKPKKKKGEKVDVVRLTAKPIVQNIAKGFVNTRKESRDFTGSSISKEDFDDEDASLQADSIQDEKILPVALAVGGALASSKDVEKKADPMSTSEGKALLTTLQEAANKLRKYLMTTRVSASNAQTPSDMR